MGMETITEIIKLKMSGIRMEKHSAALSAVYTMKRNKVWISVRGASAYFTLRNTMKRSKIMLTNAWATPAEGTVHQTPKRPRIKVNVKTTSSATAQAAKVAHAVLNKRL